MEILKRHGINWNPKDVIFTPYARSDKDVTVDYLEYVSKAGLFFYHQLDDTAKIRAVVMVAIFEIETCHKHMIKAKAKIKENIHQCINSGILIKRMINTRRALNKIKVNRNHYITSYINQNYMLFDKHGNLYDTYTLKQIHFTFL